eukprot:3940767-Rhodomonas_salina.2
MPGTDISHHAMLCQYHAMPATDIAHCPTICPVLRHCIVLSSNALPGTGTVRLSYAMCGGGGAEPTSRAQPGLLASFYACTTAENRCSASVDGCVTAKNRRIASGCGCGAAADDVLRPFVAASVCGTELAYGGTISDMLCAVLSWNMVVSQLAYGGTRPYAVCGTEVAYAANAPSCSARVGQGWGGWGAPHVGQ